MNPFLEWRTVDVVRRHTEDATFHRLETLAKLRGKSLNKLQREILMLERQCMHTKPHFNHSLAARATWITQAYNTKFGYGLAVRQTISILFVCSSHMSKLSIIENN